MLIKKKEFAADKKFNISVDKTINVDKKRDVAASKQSITIAQ